MKVQPTYSLEPIGEVISPFSEKFGIPRQPRLITAVDTAIRIYDAYAINEAFEQLNCFSHIWVHTIFHQNADKKWRPKVRPPRLGGNESMGVFATRSPFRPNHLSLSAVKLKSITKKGSEIILKTSFLDMLNGTPVLDIKPYIPYSDCITSATSSFASAAPEKRYMVTFSPEALEHIGLAEQRLKNSNIRTLIEEVLSLDPRPAYQKTDQTKSYRLKLYDFDIHFTLNGQQLEFHVIKLSTENP